MLLVSNNEHKTRDRQLDPPRPGIPRRMRRGPTGRKPIQMGWPCWRGPSLSLDPRISYRQAPKDSSRGGPEICSSFAIFRIRPVSPGMPAKWISPRIPDFTAGAEPPGQSMESNSDLMRAWVFLERKSWLKEEGVEQGTISITFTLNIHSLYSWCWHPSICCLC